MRGSGAFSADLRDALLFRIPLFAVIPIDYGVFFTRGIIKLSVRKQLPHLTARPASDSVVAAFHGILFPAGTAFI